MTLNGVMTVTLYYFTEFGKPALQKTICGGIYTSLLHFLVRVQFCRKESSRSLSHPLMSFMLVVVDQQGSVVRIFYGSILERNCPKDNTAGCVSYGQKWKTGTGRQYLRTLWSTGHSTTVAYLASKAIESCEKKQNKGYRPFKIIQGHRGGYQSKARMRLPISDLTTYLYSCGVIAAYCSSFGHFAFLRHALGGGVRDNIRCSSWAHCKARIGLPISDN